MTVAVNGRMRTENQRANEAGDVHAGASDDFDGDDTLVDESDGAEDFAEFSGSNDAFPDDRRRDPLR